MSQVQQKRVFKVFFVTDGEVDVIPKEGLPRPCQPFFWYDNNKDLLDMFLQHATHMHFDCVQFGMTCLLYKFF